MPDRVVSPLTFDALQKAVAGNTAAIRLRVRLQPAGGPGTKVFPPTHQGGIYATEKRRIGDKEVPCVLLDSVQSQANRLEQALLEAFRAKRLNFPLLTVKFPKDLVNVGEITALDAPHRIADAIFRDSILNGKPFRPQLKAGGKKDKSEVSEEGRRFSAANIRNATPLFELCPTALIFGVWDSTGAAGGLGNKFARALVSEIVGVNAVVGVRTASRLDPLGITTVNVYVDGKGDWTTNEADAVKNEKGEPVPFARKDQSQDKGKPTEINHSNIPPDIARYQDDNLNTRDILRGTEVNVNYSLSTDEGEIQQRGIIKTGEQVVRKNQVAPGGVTIEYAEQTVVLSLTGLRRLRFPMDGNSSPEADLAARTVLATLALAALAHQQETQGYDLRSRCQMLVDDSAGKPTFELVTTTTNTEPFTLTAAEADELFKVAVKRATDCSLPWRAGIIPLEPKEELVALVRKSRDLGAVEES